jgi:quercetin dioxygenase-like cupin family protein
MKRQSWTAGAAWFACAALTVALSGGSRSAIPATPDYTTPGLSAEQLAKLPGVTFARPLQDPPARYLVVVHLDFPAKATTAAPHDACTAHRHPGAATVRVTKGALRLGLAGRPVQIVRTGGVFYEPANALHTVAENASSVEPAAAVALVVVPRGAAILTPDRNCGRGAAH